MDKWTSRISRNISNFVYLRTKGLGLISFHSSNSTFIRIETHNHFFIKHYLIDFLFYTFIHLLIDFVFIFILFEIGLIVIVVFSWLAGKTYQSSKPKNVGKIDIYIYQEVNFSSWTSNFYYLLFSFISFFNK